MVIQPVWGRGRVEAGPPLNYEGGCIMPDNLNKQNPQDGRRINVNEDFEVTYWTKKFHVSEQKLKEAVHRVGPTVKSVRRELGK
jgi:hypothetical protein